MGKLRPLTESPRYKSFMSERDKALEEILAKYTRAINITLEALKNHSLDIAKIVSSNGLHRDMLRQQRNEFERRLNPWMEMATKQFTLLIGSLRRTTYTLSYVGQAEGIGRAIGKKTKYDLTKDDLKTIIAGDSQSGGQVHLRIELALHRLKTKILDAFHLSQVLESPLDETLDRIKRALPSSKQVKSFRNVMAKMKESETLDTKIKGVSLSAGVVDQDEWEKVRADYLSDELPAEDYGRAPYDKVFYASVSDEGDIETYTRYQWEVENEVTQDFVQQVRDGEMDAAKENGITDFQWISIIDKSTDECCEWRDGLTSQEIEEQLDGEHSDDECDGSVPPIHFNCRCRLAPMTEDMPEESPPDFGSFDDWVQEQADQAA